jgi:hypothetical protein
MRFASPLLVGAGVLGIVLSLGACAPAVRSDRMVPPPEAATEFTANSALRDAVGLRDVAGGEETTEDSSVGNEELRQAVQTALQQHGLLQTDDTKARFRLNVLLVKLSHPGADLSLTVNSLIRYTLTRAETGAVLFNDVVNASYTATLGDEFLGFLRLRIAKEGSIRANITAFFERLKALPKAMVLDDGTRTLRSWPFYLSSPT